MSVLLVSVMRLVTLSTRLGLEPGEDWIDVNEFVGEMRPGNVGEIA